MAGAGLLNRLIGALTRGQSLHRQLLAWLLLPQLVLWLGGAYITYTLAARYANQAIDASLLQATRSLARQVKPIGTGLLIDFPRAAQDIIEADPDDRVYYMVSSPPGDFLLGNQKLPVQAIARPRLGQPYFYDDQVHSTPVRVAALYVAYGEAGAPQTMLVQIARSREPREALARQILVDTVLPLSVLIVLMTMIVWAGIRAGLAPLSRLRALVEDRAPNDLAPLELDAAPQELRSLVQALNQLLAAVSESVTRQRRFISDAAHQLRTPLAGLKGQAEIALRENRDPALAARLERVQQSALRSAHVVNQLLTLTRADPESLAALGSERFDLRALAQELTAECVPRALQAGIDLGFEEAAGPGAPPADLTVQGHSLLLREALFNVIDNAIRYAGRGAEVTVGARAVAGHAVVEIADTGPGIAPAEQARVFERFHRATLQGDGCGLGLSIVREIVERHRGTVELGSVEPHGVRVRVSLPLAD